MSFNAKCIYNSVLYLNKHTILHWITPLNPLSQLQAIKLSQDNFSSIRIPMNKFTNHLQDSVAHRLRFVEEC